MEREMEERNEISGQRAVEKPLRGKVQTTDFSTSPGNPQKPRIPTFPPPRRLLVISYPEELENKKTQTRHRPRLTYCSAKMVLTMGSTFNQARRRSNTSSTRNGDL
jgi:hypothetical protein